MSDLDKYLKDIKSIDAKVLRKQYDYDMWYRTAQGISGMEYGERVQTSGSKQKMEYAVARYMDIEKEIIALLEQKAEFIRLIEKLEETEYEIMHKLYIEGYTLKEIRREKGKSYSWASSNFRKAKSNLKILLEGVVE